MRADTLLNWILRGIILFWAVWFTLVTASDSVNLLQVTHFLSPNIPFSSHNYNLVVKTLLVYDLQSLATGAYLAIILGCFIASILFWWAVISLNKEVSYLAFAVSLAITAIFILFDEFFIQYEFEHQHVIRLTFQIVTFLLYYLISCKDNEKFETKK
ncbi:hypothetical protein [Legionella oakridgensis]|uniref:Transmembrane protein n=2 Tax=Legionella oakridgensis TaxID=29423 RepID=W0B8B3_9GAMM|nr:hypothetical protein [Legionella oakridgensis]AHE66115.1 hypothetical protein Loa_00544 [Legionella oakridgensis ATCC 33761 = DSM 21215]KTD43862.1 hypothetical protein Loak_0412 [Legionella oakridgensis]STY16030.1 Uncharacterised protein [Legionella longbeachae]